MDPSIIDINPSRASDSNSLQPQYATYPVPVVSPEEGGLSADGLLAPNRYAQTPYTDEKEKPWVPDMPSRGV